MPNPQATPTVLPLAKKEAHPTKPYVPLLAVVPDTLPISQPPLKSVPSIMLTEAPAALKVSE
jgi:hypothetical protein